MLRLLAPLLLLLGGCFLTELEDDIDDEPLPPSPCRNGRVDDFREECDDGNGINGDGCSSACLREFPATVSWRVTTLAGEPAPCPLDHDAEVTVDSQRAVLPCEGSPQPLSLTLVRGGHPLSIRIVDRATRALWGESEPSSLTVDAGPISVTVPILADAGRLAFGWSFRNAADLTIDCALAGVTSVRTRFVPVGGGAPTEVATDCGTYRDVSPLLVAGTYDVSIRTSKHAPIALPGVVIAPRAKTPLAPVVFRP